MPQTNMPLMKEDEVTKLTQAIFDEAIKINLMAKRGRLEKENIRQFSQMTIKLESLINPIKY
jgi:hypothetical protein